MEEDTAPGLLAPAFSHLLATQRTRAPDSGGYPDATPATFEFQPPPPFSPPSARKGQSSPSPQPRANRSALRLPRPHPPRRAPSPSCFAGVGATSWLVTLPASLPPPSPSPPVAVVAPHFRSAPSCRTLRQKSAWNAPHELSWCGGRSARGKESRVRKRGRGSGAGRDEPRLATASGSALVTLDWFVVIAVGGAERFCGFKLLRKLPESESRSPPANVRVAAAAPSPVILAFFFFSHQT